MLSLLAVAGVLVLLYFTKKYFAGGVCRCRTDLSGKTIIVTGATSGIGRATAAILASRGAVVIVAYRTPSIGREAVDYIKTISKSQHVSGGLLDLTSFASIRAFVDTLESKGISNIYALINNAGVFYCPFKVTEDGYEVTFQTNYLGPFLLTNLLLKAKLVSAGSRVVNVSSEAHRFVTDDDNNVIVRDVQRAAHVSPELDQLIRYGQSKLCLNLFTLHLASLYKDIYTFSVNPGNVETDVLRTFPLTQTRYWPLLKPVRLLLVKTPFEGAQTVLHATCSRHCTDLSGSYLSDCKPLAPSKFSLDKQLASELWRASLVWCAPALDSRPIN